jgi:hypothetical protein
MLSLQLTPDLFEGHPLSTKERGGGELNLKLN